MGGGGGGGGGDEGGGGGGGGHHSEKAFYLSHCFPRVLNCDNNLLEIMLCKSFTIGEFDL